MRKRTPSSFAWCTSSARAGISSSERLYTIVAVFAPRRRAVLTESIAVFPPPTTTTCFPNGTGVSLSSLEASIKLTRVRYSLDDMTPMAFSPGIPIKLGSPAPDPTKMPL